MVDPDDSSRGVVTRNPSLCGTACYDAGPAVDTRNTSNSVPSAHRSLKRTVLDHSIVHTADAPDTFLLILGLNISPQCQVLNNAVALHVAEQTDHIPVTQIIKSRDRMANPVKYPVKHRDELKLGPRKVDIRLEAHIFIFRPGIDIALLGEISKLLRCTDIDALILDILL